MIGHLPNKRSYEFVHALIASQCDCTAPRLSQLFPPVPVLVLLALVLIPPEMQHVKCDAILIWFTVNRNSHGVSHYLFDWPSIFVTERAGVTGVLCGLGALVGAAERLCAMCA